MSLDTINWSPLMTVRKFNPDTVDDLTRMLGHEPTGADFADLMAVGLEPDNVAAEAGNLLTTVGLGRLTSLIIGAGGAAFTNAQALVGVGSSSTAAVVADTKLGGDGSTTTAYYQGADGGYPTQSGGVITCYCTFGSANANFAWNEWAFGIATGTITPGGTLSSVGTSPIIVNHKAPVSLGTKASGSSWQAQFQITLS